MEKISRFSPVGPGGKAFYIDVILRHTTHYRNLTYKHIMGLKWVSTYCSNAHTVVKVDDDTFVNIFQLTTFLRTDGYFSALNSVRESIYLHGSHFHVHTWKMEKIEKYSVLPKIVRYQLFCGPDRVLEG